MREDALWGVVGGLSFLVLLQGYELLAEVRVDPVLKIAVAVVVAVVAGISTRIARRRLLARRERNGSA